VVIQHEWRNVMTLMFSELLHKTSTGMQVDGATGLNFASIVEASCRVPDFKTTLVLIRRQKDDQELKKLNDEGQSLLHILAINAGENQPEVKESV
jgi:hypothetical protein